MLENAADQASPVKASDGMAESGVLTGVLADGIDCAPFDVHCQGGHSLMRASQTACQDEIIASQGHSAALGA